MEAKSLKKIIVTLGITAIILGSLSIISVTDAKAEEDDPCNPGWVSPQPCGYKMWDNWCNKVRTVTTEKCYCNGEHVAYKTTCTSTGPTHCYVIECVDNPE